MHQTIVLECDACATPRQTNFDETLEQLRERLAQVGWYVDSARDYDLCPGCTHKGIPGLEGGTAS